MSSSVIGTIITCCGDHCCISVVCFWWFEWEFLLLISKDKCFEQQLYDVNVVRIEQIKQVAHFDGIWQSLSDDTCSSWIRDDFFFDLLFLGRCRDDVFSSSESDRTIYVLLLVVIFDCTCCSAFWLSSSSSSPSSHKLRCALRNFSNRRLICDVVDGGGDWRFRFSVISYIW